MDDAPVDDDDEAPQQASQWHVVHDALSGRPHFVDSVTGEVVWVEGLEVEPPPAVTTANSTGGDPDPGHPPDAADTTAAAALPALAAARLSATADADAPSSLTQSSHSGDDAAGA